MRSKFEILAEKELKSQGYQVDYKIRPRFTPRGYHTDYFDLFDLIAVRAGEPVRWISIKGQAGVPSDHAQAIINFFLPEGNQKEVWQYRKLAKDRRKFERKITILTNTGVME